MFQFIQEGNFFLCKFQRIIRIYSRKMGVIQLIFLSTYCHCPLVVVYIFQKFLVFHFKLGIPFRKYSFHLKLYYGNSFVHLCYKIVIYSFLRSETSAWILSIMFHCKSCKGQKIYPVCFFQNIVVVVS